MKPKPHFPRRRATRLRGYDYSQLGAYFVTVCIQHREYLLGTISDGKMRLNEIGQIVVECLSYIPQHFPDVDLDAYVVMPNHIHGIIAWGTSLPGHPHLPDTTKDRRGEVPSTSLRKTKPVGAGSPRPSQNNPNLINETPSTSLGKIVAYFKYQSTKYINRHRNTFRIRLWQRNYHDHIIRDDTDLQRLREYIQINPMKWELDQLHPDNPSKS